MTLTVGSLFAGIGGFDLGFERAGMRTVWFCEQNPYCQAVLAKHWPGVPIHPDIRELVLPDFVDVLCGGFPCQDVSSAGKGAGLDGARSGLWSEFARLIGELRPRYVVVENVPMLRSRGLGRVLGEMAALGYDAEWDCIPACAVGAPHRRDRIWIVAYPNGEGQSVLSVDAEVASSSALTANADSAGRANAQRSARSPKPERRAISSTDHALGGSHHWVSEPNVGRVVHGVPGGMDRVRALGNALVPQIAEYIGHRIVSYETRP